MAGTEATDINSMIAAAAQAVGAAAPTAGATAAAGAPAGDAPGVTIRRQSARSIEGRAKSGD